MLRNIIFVLAFCVTTSVFGQENFFSKEYTVSHQSNRMGIRINGPKIQKRTSEDMITEGLPLGAVQVTGNGDSIITFVDHQTTGGYPKIANVIYG